MALDGIILHKLITPVQDILPARVQKVYQVSSTEILFQLHGKHGKSQLFISCHSVYNRMLLTNKNYPTPLEPNNFIMVLRKYLEGSTIESCYQAGLDRWCTFTVSHRNMLGDKETLRIIVELMGKYANLILVDPEDKIIDVLKRIPPFENSKRILMPNATFVPMEAQDKKNPFKEHVVDSSVSLVKQFAGFSPLLAREAEYRMSLGQSFSSIMQNIDDSNALYVAEEHPEINFHVIPLTHLGKTKQYPLMEGFESLYAQSEEKERIKQIAGDVYHVAKKELKHQSTKLPRLQKEYDTALDCDKYRLYGDLLYTYGITDTKGKHDIQLENYEDGKMIAVPLDPKLDGNQNAKKAYTKYAKLKKGQTYLQEQIVICQNEIEYFTGVLEQLDIADFDTALEIKQELIKLGYMKEKQKSNKRKKKKESEPNITTVTSPSGIAVSYGKNNLQNEYLTWHKARKEEIWLHAKEYHGAHVIIHASEADEATLRFAANLAAYYSSGRNSSSVPVNYCKVRQLKKIPGARPGMVQLTNYKTIYIDPEVS